MISNIAPMDAHSMEKMLDGFEFRTYEKGQAFARKGEYAKNMGFVTSGVLRAFFRGSDGTTYNKTFFKENSLIGAYSSLITGQVNRIDIECLTACEIWTSPYQSIVALYDEYPLVERFSRTLAERFFVSKEKREIQLVTLEAKERYAIFQQEHPGLDQRIPQYHIASYLGITPTQLSRIRANK
ncbi:MAG: Crp/Fnr family transcriptional regulator [Cytophagales bacterium]|nr:Crp/Fnr family transcriptional regulator [Cytophagales bacterium]